jgi:ABC-type proline/glycine betaine transport system permease subunit
MARPVSTQPEMPAILPGRRLASAIAIGAVAFGALAVAGALGLWFHYGTAVLFEMITAGISACF